MIPVILGPRQTGGDTKGYAFRYVKIINKLAIPRSKPSLDRTFSPASLVFTMKGLDLYSY